MAKKQVLNKTQAVRDYLATHPGAMSSEIAAALAKQGIKITRGHVANIKTKINKTHKARKTAKKPAVVVAAAPVAVEKPAKAADAITLDQVKKVSQAMRTLGGFQRVLEVLDVIREMGGVKKFKDLAEAMSVPTMDDIPF
jgi:hypothetical protein